jgi:hypothetical protein
VLDPLPAILLLERLFGHEEITQALEKSDYGWNKLPAEDQIDDPLARAVEIKFMQAQASQEHSEQDCK